MATAFPVDDVNDASSVDLRIQDFNKTISGLDGYSSATTVVYSASAFGVNVLTQLALHPYLADVQSIQLYSTRDLVGTWGTSSVPISGQSFIIKAFIPLIIPINLILRSGDVLTVTMRQWLDTTQTDARVFGNFVGHLRPNELMTGTKIKACIVGDSINAGSSATRIENMYNFMLRNHLRKQGVSISIPYNKSVKGIDTATQLRYFRDGGNIIEDCNLYFIALGANDSAIASRSKADYKANMNEIIDLIFYKEVQPVILLEAPTLNQNATIEGLNIQYRAAIQEIVAERNSDRIYSVDLGTGSFDNQNAANYVGTDTAGSRIHPSDLGNLGIWNNNLLPWLISNTGINFINKLKTLR